MNRRSFLKLLPCAASVATLHQFKAKPTEKIPLLHRKMTDREVKKVLDSLPEAQAVKPVRVGFKAGYSQYVLVPCDKNGKAKWEAGCLL